MSKKKTLPNIPFQAFVFRDVYLTNNSSTLFENFDPKYITNLESLHLQTFTNIDHYEVIGVKASNEVDEERLFRISFSYGSRWMEPLDSDDATENVLQSESEEAESDDRIALATIEASFICEYALKTDKPEEIEKDSYTLFARNIGSMETWPYWREFLTSQITRMHLTGVKTPKRRRPEEPVFD